MKLKAMPRKVEGLLFLTSDIGVMPSLIHVGRIVECRTKKWGASLDVVMGDIHPWLEVSNR